MKSKAIFASASTVALIALTPYASAQMQAPAAAPAAAPDPAAAQSNPQAQPDPQEDAADKTSGIQDIVVTATRQATNQQATPIAITAVTSEQLEVRGLKSAADLSAVVPNATFRKAPGGFGPGVTAFIRGIGQNDTSLGSEPAVAYYVDDVYYPLLLGSNFDLLDLDHIEVLRGPQGTLFGRNALAGAVNIVSKQPSLTEARGYAQVTVGDYNRRDFRAGFNVPLNDMLALQVGAVSKQRQGYQRVLDFRCEMNRRGTPALAGTLPYVNATNTAASNNAPTNCTIGHQGGEDVRAIKGTLLFKPSDNVRLTLNADYTHDTSENPADQLLAVTGPGAANLQSEAAKFGVAYDARFLTGNRFTTYASYQDPVGSGVVIPGNTFYNGVGPQRGGAVFSPRIDLTNKGVSGRLVIGLTEAIDLTTIVGYRSLKETHAFDIDASPLVLEHTSLNIGEHYTNVESRLSGKSSVLDWVVGGFYFKGSGFTRAITYSPQSGFYKIQNIRYNPESEAVFANATVKPFDGVNVTLGGRYSRDVKAVDFSNVLDTNAGTNSHVGDTIFQIKPKAKRFDWKLGADYHVSDRVMIYASAATGARLPGYNTRPQQPSQVQSFDGDETLAYELGFKADLFDRKLRLNGTAFYTDYKTRYTNLTGAEPNTLTGVRIPGNQTVIPLPAAGPDGTSCRPYVASDGPANLATGVGVTCIPRTFFVNTPGKVKGFEMEVEINPVAGLLINGSVGYQKFTSPDLKLATRANDRLPNIPEINANVGIQYALPVAALAGSITPRLDWAYTGSIFPSAARNTYNQPAYSVFNGRIGYANEEHAFTLAVGATNLFSKKYYQNFFVYQDIGFPNNNGQPAAPRQLFLELGKKF